LNSALNDSEWPVTIGTRTQVPETRRSGGPRTLRLSLWTFYSSSVSKDPSKAMPSASEMTLKETARTPAPSADYRRPGTAMSGPETVRRGHCGEEVRALRTHAGTWECAARIASTRRWRPAARHDSIVLLPYGARSQL
jgi:hypothetical protein